MAQVKGRLAVLTGGGDCPGLNGNLWYRKRIQWFDYRNDETNGLCVCIRDSSAWRNDLRND